MHNEIDIDILTEEIIDLYLCIICHKTPAEIHKGDLSTKIECGQILLKKCMEYNLPTDRKSWHRYGCITILHKIYEKDLEKGIR